MANSRGIRDRPSSRAMSRFASTCRSGAAEHFRVQGDAVSQVLIGCAVLYGSTPAGSISLGAFGKGFDVVDGAGHDE